MSAEVLRKAAALMRERAEAAASDLGEPVADPVTWRGIGTGYREPIKDHIASWHPAMALEIASLLEHEAKRAEVAEQYGDYDERHWMSALTIARAYLGGAA